MPEEDIYQFKLRIEHQLFDRLSKLADRCGYSSPNQFATEALNQYAEVMADLMIEQKKGLRLLRDEQRERLLEALKTFDEKRRRK